MKRKFPMLFVAGTRQEAHYWAQQLGFAYGEWHFIEAHSTHGYRVETIFFVGTYREREDWPELQIALQPIGAEWIFAEEMVPVG